MTDLRKAPLLLAAGVLLALAACAILTFAGCNSSGSGSSTAAAAATTGPAPTGTNQPPPPPPGGTAPVGSTLDATLRNALANAGVRPVDLRPAAPQAMIDLGRSLFFDKVISGNRNISCASCHNPAAETGDALPLAVGEGGVGDPPSRTFTNVDQVVARNAPPLFHVAAMGVDSMFWDGRVHRDPVTGDLQTPEPALNGPTPLRPDMAAQLTTALAAQAMFPPATHAEMLGYPGDNELADAGSNLKVWAGIMARLVGTSSGTVGGIQAYRDMFQAAFPGVALDDLTFAHAARAIAAFEMSAYARFRSPFDRYLAGDDTALSDQAKRGGLLFAGPARCTACHRGPLLSDQHFHDIAIPQLGPGASGGDDLGRAGVTGDPRDDYAFKTPALRDVALTGPYMHDGAFSTLEAVLHHYRDPAGTLLNYDATQLPAAYQSMVDTDPTRNQARLANIARAVGNGIAMSDQQIQDIVAFLHSLTDPNPPPAAPASVPSGLPVTGK